MSGKSDGVDVIEQFTHDFELALNRAVGLHARGVDQQSIAGMLAVAQEIIGSVAVEMRVTDSQGTVDDSDTLADLQARLEATEQAVRTRVGDDYNAGD